MRERDKSRREVNDNLSSERGGRERGGEGVRESHRERERYIYI